MRIRTLFLAAATVAALLLSLAGAPAPAKAPADKARSVTPPKGFMALFNGRDLSGWHGMPHYDPRTLTAMPGTEALLLGIRWMDDARKHWTVEKDELVNDGNGAY